MTVNELITPIVKKQLEARLEALKKMEAPAITIAQVERQVNNPLLAVKMLKGTGLLTVIDYQRRKTALVITVENNPNRVVLRIGKNKGWELVWMLAYQVENVR